MIMVILGGVGRLQGGALGAAVLLIAEECDRRAHDPLAARHRRGAARRGAVRAGGPFRPGARDGAPTGREHMTAPTLRVTGSQKRFGGVLAVDDVNLDVAEGEVHALIGPNGAGKTTLVHLLSGALARAPARSCSTAATSPAWPCTGASGSGWRARTRSPACFRTSLCSRTWRSRLQGAGAPG